MYKLFVSFTLFLLVTPSVIHAQNPVSDQVIITAVVPLSDIWEHALKENSKAKLVSDHVLSGRVDLSLTVQGLENKLMKNEKLRLEIVKDGEIIESVTGITNDQGVAQFSPIITDHGEYEFRFIITTYDFDKEVVISDTVNYTKPPLLDTLHFV